MNEISCKITSSFLEYVKHTRPEILAPLLAGLPYDEGFLSDPDNWVPWDTERILEERLVRLFDDERIMFEIGRSVISLKSLGMVRCRVLSRGSSRSIAPTIPCYSQSMSTLKS